MKSVIISEDLYKYIDELKEILEADSHEEIIWQLITVCNISTRPKYEENPGYQ